MKLKLCLTLMLSFTTVVPTFAQTGQNVQIQCRANAKISPRYPESVATITVNPKGVVSYIRQDKSNRYREENVVIVTSGYLVPNAATAFPELVCFSAPQGLQSKGGSFSHGQLQDVRVCISRTLLTQQSKVGGLEEIGQNCDMGCDPYQIGYVCSR